MKDVTTKGVRLRLGILALSILVPLFQVHGQNQWITLPDGKRISSNKNAPFFYSYTIENGKLKSQRLENPQDVVKVIVTLKDEPLALYRNKYALQKSSLANVLTSLQSVHSSVRNKIGAIAQQLYAKTDFQYQYRVRREYYTAINGMALECNRGMMTYIRSLPEVKNVQIDREVKVDLIQSVHQIRADIVQDSLGYTGDGVLVGEIDTGIDYYNPALGGGFGPQFRVIGGHDFANDDNDPRDDNGHGTQVAGIIGADGGKDLRGVAPKVKFLAVKVLDKYGMGYTSDIIAGIEYCIDPDRNPATDDGVDVINMSLGALPWGDFSMAADEAVDNATKAGILSVIAAGNDGVPSYYLPWSGPYRTISSPGTAVSALTVGACDSTYWIADFSSKGPDRIHFAIKPEVVAPGVDILSFSTSSLSGTSMATPHVTGVAALLKQQHRDWSPEQLKSVIVNSAKIMTGLDELYIQGNGCVDALNAAKLGVSVQPGVINFGIVDLSAEVWKDTIKFTVKNFRNTSQNINLEIQSGLPAGAELNLNQTSFNLASMQEMQVTATITMPKTVSIVYNYPYGYTGNIICRSDSDRILIPFAVIKTNILTIESDFTASDLWLYDQSNYINITWQAAGVNNKYSLPVDNSAYNLFAELTTFTIKNNFYNIFRKINTAESNHIILNHNEAVFSAFNDLYQIRDIHDNPVNNINYSPINLSIHLPHVLLGFSNFTPHDGQWLFGSMDSSVSVVQSLLSVRGNEAILLNAMSSGIKAQSDLTFLSGPENLRELNFKFNYMNSSTTKAFIETEAAQYGNTYYDWWCMESGFILPDSQQIHFMTNRNSTIFNPMNYFSMSAGFGTFNDPMQAPIWKLGTSDFIVDEKGDFVFLERKPFRPDLSEYMRIQILPSGDTVSVEEGAPSLSVQVPKFQFSYPNDRNELSVMEYTPDSYDDGGVIRSDGIRAKILKNDYSANIQQITAQMFSKNGLLQAENSLESDASFYYVYNGNRYIDRYRLMAETGRYKLLGQYGQSTIDYEFNIRPVPHQDCILPSLDFFQILGDDKPVQWLHRDQDGKVRLVISDPKQNVDSVGIFLLENDGTEIGLATTHPCAKEYLASIPKDAAVGYHDVIARVNNTEGNTFELIVSPAFYNGSNEDSIQCDSRLRLKTYTLNNSSSIHFNPGDTLKYTLAYTNYGNYAARNVTVHFPQTDYFVPAGASTLTIDSIGFYRGDNSYKIPLTLVFLGKKQPGDILSHYTPSISWNSRGRSFSRKHQILVDFSASLTGVSEFENAVSKEYSLFQNYPNPVNPTTTISFSLPSRSFVSLKVFDVLGREVETLVNEHQNAGIHSVTFNAAGLPSGVYFYRLQAATFTKTKKLMVLK